MNLEITEELYRYTFAEKNGEYIFDPDSFIVCRTGSDEASAIKYPVVFPAISQIEEMKAYVKQLNNTKIQHAFNHLTDEEYKEVFWKYFDDEGNNLMDVNQFEKYFRIKRIIDWCNDNGISYFIKDEYIKKALTYFSIK